MIPPAVNKSSMERFCKAIVLGAKVPDACRAAGFSHSRYRELASDGERNPDGPNGWIVRMTEEARGQAVASLLASIRKSAAAGQWQAAAWILERAHGYRKPPEVEVEVNAKGSVVIIPATLAPADWEALADDGDSDDD